jgi:hypothetical protein
MRMEKERERFVDTRYQVRHNSITIRSRKQVCMRGTEKKRATVPVQRRRSRVRSGKRGAAVSNPFHKLRGAGLQGIDVDRYLASVRGR